MYRYQETVAALVVESGEKLEKSAKMNVSTGLLEDAGWGSRSLFSHSRSGLHNFEKKYKLAPEEQE